MGNWCMKFINKNNKKKIVILLLGLDNAGKTVTANQLERKDSSSVLPTMGFSIINISYDKHSVLIYELGGSEQIRNIWHKYYIDVHGLIFVVDSSDSYRLTECELILNELLSHQQIQGKPVLLLANKQDCAGALDEIDLVEKLHLEDIVNKYQCPTLVQPCIAKMSSESDSGIVKGFNWLVGYILNNYDQINARVLFDVEAQQKQEIITKRIKKVTHQTFMNGCFGDSSSVTRNIEECLESPKRSFLLTALANSTNKFQGRPGSCPANEGRFNISVRSNRRVKSAVGYVAEQQDYKRTFNKNPRRQRKYLSSFSLFNNRNKVGVIEY